MFLKHYLYCIKCFLVNRSLSFWSLLFPFILATLFFLGFGNLLKDANVFNPIPTAVVIDADSENAEYYRLFLDAVTDQEDPVLDVTETTLKEAEHLLEDEQVDGILTFADKAALTVSGTGINQTVLKNLVDIYERKAELFRDIGTNHPEQFAQVAESRSDETAYLKEISLSGTKSNGNAQYFYALIAMTCLNACFFGLSLVSSLQANLSDLAARRCCAPIRKLRVVLCDFLAAVTVEYAILLLLFAYLIHVVKVDFGRHLGLTLLTALAGTVFGVALGMFIGAANTWPMGSKVGILLSITLGLCFLAGLMFNMMPDIIEKHLPIINRLNPALLISNSFYCLTYYDNLTLYLRNMLTLAVFSAVLCLASVLLLRRKKYASL